MSKPFKILEGPIEGGLNYFNKLIIDIIFYIILKNKILKNILFVIYRKPLPVGLLKEKPWLL